MRSRTRAAVGVAAIAAIAGALFGARQLNRRAELQRARAAWLTASRCLLGPEPLDGERASERVRRIALGVAERDAAGRQSPSDAGWPRRCAPALESLRLAWTTLHDRDDAVWSASAIDAPLRLLSSELQAGRSPDDALGASSQLDGLVTLAREFDVPVGPRSEPSQGWPAGGRRARSDGVDSQPATVSEQSAAPIAAAPRRWTDLPVVVADATVVEWSTFVGADVRFRTRGSVCQVVATADAETTLRSSLCKPRHPSIPTGASEALTPAEDGAASAVSVFDYERGGVFSVETGDRRLAAGMPTSFGAYVKQSGSVFAVDRPVLGGSTTPTFAPRFDLVARGANGKLVREPIDAPKPNAGSSADPHLVGEHLLWLEPLADGAQRLRARSVRETEPYLGPIEEIGTVSAGLRFGSSPAACRTADALSVVLTSGDGHVALAVRTGDGWKRPVAVDPHGRLSCVGREAIWVSATPRAGDRADLSVVEVRQTRCNGETCETKAVVVPTPVPHGRLADHGVVAMRVGDAVALAYRGEAVFLRVAPLDELPKAPVRALLDANPRKAGGELVHALHAVSRGAHGLLFVGGSRGLHAFVVDATEGTHPVRAR